MKQLHHTVCTTVLQLSTDSDSALSLLMSYIKDKFSKAQLRQLNLDVIVGLSIISIHHDD